jgi:hypothetical protein
MIAELRSIDDAAAPAARATKAPAALAAPVKKKSAELSEHKPHDLQRSGLRGAETSVLDAAISTFGDLSAAWQAALSGVGGLLAENARSATVAWRKSKDATAAPNQVVATFTRQYNFGKQFCERPENLAKLQQALGEALGHPAALLLASSEADSTPPAPHVEMRKPTPSRQRLNEKAEHPWVKRATELFDARVVWIEEPQG